ncbi:MAG TPA: thioredoxin domain-containing protein [Anaerolineae bacterium]|nr:thioredoxin domain-containing protein [Anaerolineae bacterium]
MSEQYIPDAPPPEEIPPIPQVVESSTEAPLVTTVAETPTRTAPRWIAPVWFFFGIIVGIVGFAAYNAVIVKPAAPSAQAESVDVNADMKNAAREGVLEAIATLQAGSGQQQPSAQEQQGPQTVASNAFTVRPANRLGNADAKVTIVEFADYQCPFCKRYHDTVGPDLLKQYVDSGKVSFVYKHSAFLGQESIWAAQAAECAADQGKFWEYHDLLFSKQNGENVGTFTKENLMAYAKELGLDSTQFDPCLQNDVTLQRVISDTNEGRQVGVSGTPTFFINGKPLVGAQPLQAFQDQIDALLAQ